jgi:hypothetical protein
MTARKRSVGPVVAVIALGITAFLMGAAAIASLRDSGPIERSALVAVEPQHRVLNRNETLYPTLRVTREICARRTQRVSVTRNWVEFMVSEQARPIVIFTTLQYDLLAGCHLITVDVTVPRSLPPGVYLYDVVVRGCDFLGRCEDFKLTPVPVSIVGGSWPNAAVPPPPSLPNLEQSLP